MNFLGDVQDKNNGLLRVSLSPVYDRVSSKFKIS